MITAHHVIKPATLLPPPNDTCYVMNYAPDDSDQEDLYDDPDDFLYLLYYVRKIFL